MRSVVGRVERYNDTQVYGLGAMSLWQTDMPIRRPVFKIARLDEVYAGF
jgi:hypothetical protein